VDFNNVEKSVINSYTAIKVIKNQSFGRITRRDELCEHLLLKVKLSLRMALRTDRNFENLKSFHSFASEIKHRVKAF